MSAALQVALLQFTSVPERAVASAGRLCYAPVSAAELKDAMSDEDVARLVRGLVRSGHHSALEHASFTFAIDGISRGLFAPTGAAPGGFVQPAVATLCAVHLRRRLHHAAEVEANAEAREKLFEAMESARRSY